MSLQLAPRVSGSACTVLTANMRYGSEKRTNRVDAIPASEQHGCQCLSPQPVDLHRLSESCVIPADSGLHPHLQAPHPRYSQGHIREACRGAHLQPGQEGLLVDPAEEETLLKHTDLPWPAPKPLQPAMACSWRQLSLLGHLRRSVAFLDPKWRGGLSSQKCTSPVQAGIVFTQL